MKCDRCTKETNDLYFFPFIYKMWNHPRTNAKGYVQFFGCKECTSWELRLTNYKRWKHHGIRTDAPLLFSPYEERPCVLLTKEYDESIWE